MSIKQVAALLFMLFIAFLTTPWLFMWSDDLSKRTRILLWVVVVLFGFPPLAVLWITGVFG